MDNSVAIATEFLYAIWYDGVAGRSPEWDTKGRSDHEKDFIDDDLIWKQLNDAENPTKEQVRAVLKKSDNCVRLEPEETAILIQNKDPETIQEMYDLAYKLKHEVYADRLVLFAPLYCSDECVNRCKYCGFRGDNGVMKRKTLTQAEVAEEVKAMINEGQKRTILVQFLCIIVK